MELAGVWIVGRVVEPHEPIRDVVATLVARVHETLRHLIDIGVGYLSLNRASQ